MIPPPDFLHPLIIRLVLQQIPSASPPPSHHLSRTPTDFSCLTVSVPHITLNFNFPLALAFLEPKKIHFDGISTCSKVVLNFKVYNEHHILRVAHVQHWLENVSI